MTIFTEKMDDICWGVCSKNQEKNIQQYNTYDFIIFLHDMDIALGHIAKTSIIVRYFEYIWMTPITLYL